MSSERKVNGITHESINVLFVELKIKKWERSSCHTTFDLRFVSEYQVCTIGLQHKAYTRERGTIMNP
uniref:Ovule protein n=1 Tax=Heterorhabditis bacteriophora TaxID=37862 RepID=A0A1I7WPA4_HETBA